MRVLWISALAALSLQGAGTDSRSILDEVAKLRQKYEECRQGQSAVLGVDPKKYQACESERADAVQKVSGYRKRIAALENELKDANQQLSRLKSQVSSVERELSQKKGIIVSLEKTLTSRDKKYREALTRNEALSAETNTAKVSRIERQKLTDSLVAAKNEVQRLQATIAKMSKERSRLESRLNSTDTKPATARPLPAAPLRETKAVATAVPSPDQNGKIKALQDELAKANALILKLQNIPSVPQEKVVTKVVEPTDKIIALQRELASAQTTIANLKNSTKTTKTAPTAEKVVYKDRPVEKIVEKVVYKDRPVEKIVEKVVYKDRPVEKIVEKVVYKDRPVIQEKIVTKTVEPTDKIKALEAKLAKYEKQASLQNLQQARAQAPKPVKTSTVIAAAPAVEAKKVQNVSSPTKKGASAYRMAATAPIYNAPGGRQIDTWEDRRSFTAGNPSNGWVHITGYFVNRVWQPTQEDEHLWVKESDVIRR